MLYKLRFFLNIIQSENGNTFFSLKTFVISIFFIPGAFAVEYSIVWIVLILPVQRTLTQLFKLVSDSIRINIGDVFSLRLSSFKDT